MRRALGPLEAGETSRLKTKPFSCVNLTGIEILVGGRDARKGGNELRTHLPARRPVLASQRLTLRSKGFTEKFGVTYDPGFSSRLLPAFSPEDAVDLQGKQFSQKHEEAARNQVEALKYRCFRSIPLEDANQSSKPSFSSNRAQLTAFPTTDSYCPSNSNCKISRQDRTEPQRWSAVASTEVRRPEALGRQGKSTNEAGIVTTATLSCLLRRGDPCCKECLLHSAWQTFGERGELLAIETPSRERGRIVR